MQARDPIISQLVALDTLKTWSVIVTLFGDLDGEELSGTQIRTLLCHIGIKPEAIRVALHRLKSDGWITSRRHGREAVYRMSDAARAETDAVASDIYQRRRNRSGSWHIQLFREAPSHHGIFLINKNLAIVPGEPEPLDKEALCLTPLTSVIPPWIEETLVSGMLIQLADKLHSIVVCYSTPNNALDTIAFRLLALHHWRRIALRPGSRAHASLVPDGPIAQCHGAVVKFLAATSRISAQF